jgi:hypothetical protein
MGFGRHAGSAIHPPSKASCLRAGDIESDPFPGIILPSPRPKTPQAF